MKTTEELKNLFESRLKPALLSMEEERLKLKKKTITAMIGILVPVAFFFIFKEHTTFPIAIFLFLVISGFLFMAIKLEKQKAPYQKSFKENVVKHIVQIINPKWQYDSEGKILKEDFISSQLFREKIYEYKGDDLVTGVIDKTAFQFSELKVKERIKSGDKTEVRVFFQGLFAHADFNKEIQGKTFVFTEAYLKMFRSKEKHFIANGEKIDLVKLENPVFEELFLVYGSDPIESRYVLTPSMMEAMIAIKNKYKNPIQFAFNGSRVYIAMGFAEELFEPKIFSSGVNFKDMELISSQFKIVETIVQEMNLNTRIWTKD